jgi:GNAT superfamily N-acetyltransferase
MQFQDYDYTGSQAEFLAMRDLLIESYAITRRPFNWLFDRLEDWKYGGNSNRIADDPDFFRRNAHLWRAAQARLIAFCISEYGGNQIFLQVHPEYRFVEPAMLDWAETRWAAGQDALETFAEVDDPVRQALLAARGYTDAGDDGYMRRYDLALDYAPLPLPAGYRIESLDQNRNYASRIAAVQRAFNQPALGRAWLESMFTAPSYEPAWDLSVLAPDGRHVAFCLAMLDRRNRIAEIDPVGTDPDYQQRGLAKALLTECFRRLQAAGMACAYIGAAPEPYKANRLYEALRPVAKYQTNRWVKSLR